MDEVVISIDNVSKDFLLPHEKVDSIKGLVMNFGKGSPWKMNEVQHALKNISFDIKKGEFFGIVGRNGSGKSTLLKMLAGIYQPTEGKISIEGRLVPFIELGVGFNHELTGRENVYLNGALLGFTQKEMEAQYESIVEFSELERFMDQKLKNYSSGMQVRLAFSLAIQAKADILLFDEVLAVGDADFQRKCYNYFSQLKKNNTTVVFVSHDMTAVREYCDRVMLIDENKLIAIGSTDDISQKYLKLFMDDSITRIPGVDTDEDRWGDRKIVISNVSTKVSSKKVVIEVKIKANEDFHRPIAGFRLRDAAGVEITGTNTRQEKVTIPSLAKDDTVSVIWEFANILRDGQYEVDIALQYPDEIAVADWWNGATFLIVNKDRHLPYNIDPGFITTIK